MMLECPICARVRPNGPEAQLVSAWDGVQMAVPREHGVVSSELKQTLQKLLLMYARKHQRNGMFDDRPHHGIVGHYAARWETINSAALSFTPQELADALAMRTQEAIEWFHDSARVMLGDPTVRTIPDDEVHQRVMGMQYVMDKEIMRINGGGPITRLIDPGTMDGYDDFLEWYEGMLARRGTTTVYESAETVLRYDLTALPFEQQRALVEQWERIHLDYLAAHPEIGYDIDGGYLRRPYLIFDRKALSAAWKMPDLALGYYDFSASYREDYP